MNADIFLLLWTVFPVSVWIQLALLPVIQSKVGPVHHLSKDDILQLKTEENPKCFTRNGGDFTCFFEMSNNMTLDFFYYLEEEEAQRCEMSVNETEDGTFLHVCTFPETDVFLFVPFKIQVVNQSSNKTVFERTISVDEQFLIDPPYNVSLKPTGHVGQLSVSWQTTSTYILNKQHYKVRFSSKRSGEKIHETESKHLQHALAPGDEVQVQVSAKCGYPPHDGHWSSWSKPERTLVPQSADDISLTCSTSNLNNLSCHWDGNAFGAQHEYKLFYKLSIRNSSEWTNWTECLGDKSLNDSCYFYADEFRKIKTKLGSASGAWGRTFYGDELKASDIIKTVPPSNLRGALREGQLLLWWDAPFPYLGSHLLYEILFQIEGGEEWQKTKGPATFIREEFPSGSRFRVQIRAKPNETIYSGYWSDWSDVLTGETPQDMFLSMFRIVPTVAIAVLLLCVFCLYCRKFKEFFWPPVPNLEKVLQDFLTDMNQQKWGPLIVTKPCFEETTSSMVEVLSEEEGLDQTSEDSSDLLPSDGTPATDVPTDYVTLNKELDVLYQRENSYVYEQVRDGVHPELLQTCSADPACLKSLSCNSYFNRSYQHMGHCADRSTQNLKNPYTNLPCS